MEAIWNSGTSWVIYLQNLGSWLKTPMEAFSFLGTENFFLVLLPALYWCVETGIGLRIGIILLLSTSVNDGLKMAFRGPRPYWFSPDVIAYAKETSFGVPSGHAQNAIAIWGMLAAGIRKWWAWTIAIIVVLLNCISRIYLGVHFPVDVFIGLVVGAVLLWIVLRSWKPVTNWLAKMSLGQQILWAFLGSLVLVIFPFIPYAWLKIINWQAPQSWAVYAKDAITLNGAFTTAGVFFGLLTGLAWFNRQGGFNPSGPIWKRFLRFLLGMVGVLVFYVGLSALFGMLVPESEAILSFLLRYIRYFLVGIWMSAGAPWLFVRLKLADAR